MFPASCLLNRTGSSWLFCFAFFKTVHKFTCSDGCPCCLFTGWLCYEACNWFRSRGKRALDWWTCTLRNTSQAWPPNAKATSSRLKMIIFFQYCCVGNESVTLFVCLSEQNCMPPKIILKIYFSTGSPMWENVPGKACLVRTTSLTVSNSDCSSQGEAWTQKTGEFFTHLRVVATSTRSSDTFKYWAFTLAPFRQVRGREWSRFYEIITLEFMLNVMSRN